MASLAATYRNPPATWEIGQRHTRERSRDGQMPNADGTMTQAELGTVIRRTKAAAIALLPDGFDRALLELQLQSLLCEWDIRELARR